jgi:hypothetical protein
MARQGCTAKACGKCLKGLVQETKRKRKEWNHTTGVDNWSLNVCALSFVYYFPFIRWTRELLAAYFFPF